MSVLTVWLERDRAVVCVDTETVDRAGARAKCASKLVPLVGPHALLTGRGTLPFLSTVTNACVALANDLDSLLEILPPCLGDLFSASLQQAAASGLSAGPE